MNRAELADFLRRRREALQPADVGLNAGERRRTSGLRREEVALVTGMSADYYTRLEQQRGPSPSPQMVLALSRGLRLTLDERDHLFRLTGHNPPARSRRSGHVGPAMLRVLDSLDTPAFVVEDLGATLAQNVAAVALFGEASRHTGLARSAYYRWFMDAGEREYYPPEDHAHQLRVQAASLRAAISIGGEDAASRELLAALLAGSAEFAELWPRHDVAQRFDDHKVLVHPELGRIDVDCLALMTEDQSQVMVVLTGAPGSESAEKLRMLNVIGAQQFARSSEASARTPDR